jgi:hypothetical protein
VTAPVTLTPAAARPAAVLTAAPTGSSDAGSGTSSTDGVAAGRDDAARPRDDAARAREPAFGLAAPAAFAPGFALVRAAFGERAGFAAGLPSASAFAAALAAESRFAAAESRFALRLPGRELGRFPSTPPSSAMDSDSSSARSGYTEAVVVDDKVVRGINWLTG